VAGAELVLLRHESAGGPLVAAQAPLPEEESWVDEALHAADALVRAEEFDARPGGQCRFCALRRACPASDEGREVLP
jgi:hypothetical protein